MKSFRLSFLLFPWFLLAGSAAGAFQILFYCNSSDDASGAVKRCVPILRGAGNQVTVIDMKGKNHDPAQDNWGAPYDQVWDMRFVDRDSTVCGSGRPSAADHFDGRWRHKAVHFLDHCGKLFIAGEHYTYVDRDEGLYRFLWDIGAVKKGYDTCPPAEGGNSSTDGKAFYPVRHGLGPVSFFGAYVGGIPLAFLNGTSFVETDEDWESDSVNRSIVSGWTGTQMTGLTAPNCNRGKLFMVWDATMWTAGWTKEEAPEGEVPIWNDEAWQPGQIDTERKKERPTEGIRQVTARFFPAVARWLGSGACPCGSPVPDPWTPTPTSTPASLWVKVSPAVRMDPTLAVPSVSTEPILAMAAAQTLIFEAPPVNIYMRFKDGPGEYRLDIYDGKGRHLNNPFDRAITLEKDSWTSWNGTDGRGTLMFPGSYFAYLTKDGKFLRKIALNWVRP